MAKLLKPIGICVLAVVLVGAPSIYIAGYFLAGECWVWPDENVTVRVYRYEAIKAAYWPMGVLEGAVTGRGVELNHDDSATSAFGQQVRYR